MPVVVEVPIRIKIDAEALDSGGFELGSAFETAVRRALSESKVRVLEPRGAYYGVTLDGCSFEWEGLDTADERREQVEELLQSCVDRCVEASGVLELAQLNELAPCPLSEEFSERLDGRRRNALFETYRIPRYDTEESTAVPVETAAPMLPVPVIAPATMLDLRDSETLVAMLEGIGVFLPFTGLRCLLVRMFGSTADYAFVVCKCVTSPTGEHGLDSMGYLANDVWSYEFVQEGDEGRFTTVRQAGLPAMPGTLHRLQFGPDNEENADLLQPFTEQSIYEQLRSLPVPEGMTTADMPDQLGEGGELGDALRDMVRREVERRAAAAGQDRQVLVFQNERGAWVFALRAEDRFEIFGTETSCPVVPSIAWTEIAASTDDPDARGGAGSGSGSGRGSGDGAGASGGGGAAGSGTGTSDGSEAGSTGPGAAMFTGTTSEADTGLVFPAYASDRNWIESALAGQVDSCASFQGEPSCHEIGEPAAGLRGAIDVIAGRLQMAPCYYAANFCIMAAQQIQSMAFDAAQYAINEGSSAVQPVTDREVAEGAYRIRPTASPAIQLMRNLGGTVALIDQLSRDVLRVYGQPGVRERVLRDWYSNFVSWELHFRIALTSELEAAVARVFEQSCRVVLLQMLNTSLRQILARINNFDRYAPLFENMITHWLRSPVELMGLREALRLHRFTEVALPVAASFATVGPQWIASARQFAALFDTTAAAAPGRYTPGEVVAVGGVDKIADSRGRLWSAEELDNAIVTRRGMAEDIDPFIQQVRDLPDTFSRFENDPDAVQTVLAELLSEMLANNIEMTMKTRSNPMFAFRASTIQDSATHANVRGTGFVLGGIHIAVHEQIAESFQGSTYYARGVDFALSAEAGRQSLLNFAVGLELVILTVFCPPLAFVVGVAVAAHELDRAYERERLHGALINPEQVLSRAEVEAGIFVAWLGFALSFIPEVGTLARAGIQGTRVGMRAGLRMGVTSAGRYVARRMVREAIEAASRDLLSAFVRELVEDQVLNLVIERAMAPLIEYYQREAMITGSVGGSEGARAFLGSSAPPLPPRESALTTSSPEATIVSYLRTPAGAAR